MIPKRYVDGNAVSLILEYSLKVSQYCDIVYMTAIEPWL